MAKSGKCTLTQETQSIADNTTIVNVSGIITTSGESYRGDQRTGTYTIKRGTTTIKTGSFAHGAPKNSTTTLFTVSVTVTHDSDGSCPTVTASYNYDSSWCTGSGSLTPTTIPRAAAITAAPNFNDEENPAITYSNPAGNTASTLQVCIASTDGREIYIPYRDINKNGTSYTFDLTDEERNDLRNLCANAKSMNVRFYIKTILAGNTYYSSSQRTFTIINAVPVIEATAMDINSATLALTGDENTLVKYKSNVSVSVIGTAQKGAAIKSYAIACGDKSISEASGTLEAVENATVTCSVTDSRGYVSSVTLVKSMVAYIMPSCVFAPSQPSADGRMSFEVSGMCYHGSFGSEENAISVQYRYKPDDEVYSEWLSLTDIAFTDGKYTANGSVDGLDYTKTYKFQAQITDNLGNAQTSEYGISINPLFYWGKDAFYFNVPVIVQGLNLKEKTEALDADLKGKATLTQKEYSLTAASNAYVSPYTYYLRWEIPTEDLEEYGTAIYAGATGTAGMAVPCSISNEGTIITVVNTSVNVSIRVIFLKIA